MPAPLLTDPIAASFAASFAAFQRGGDAMAHGFTTLDVHYRFRLESGLIAALEVTT